MTVVIGVEIYDYITVFTAVNNQVLIVITGFRFTTENAAVAFS